MKFCRTGIHHSLDLSHQGSSRDRDLDSATTFFLKKKEVHVFLELQGYLTLPLVGRRKNPVAVREKASVTKSPQRSR